MIKDPLEREVDKPSESEIEDLEQRRVKSLEDEDIDEGSILRELHKNIGYWDAYWSDNRTRGKDDCDFLFRDQWTSIERGEFQRLFRPALQFNKLHDPYRKIVGEQRQNTPNIKVRSVSGKADQKAINLRTNLVKTIAYNSNTTVVYQTAFECALSRGYGAFRVYYDYESSTSFNQVIKYEAIQDPDRCFFDPRATLSHKGDGNYCGLTTVMTKQEFEAMYPNVPYPISYVTNQKLTDFVWQTKDTITVCDYYIKEWYSCTIYLLSNGEAVKKEEYEELEKTHKEATKHVAGANKALVSHLIPDLPHVIAERASQDYKIMHYRCIQDKVLEFKEFLSRQLPLVFVDGDSYYIQGRQYTRSFITYAKDSQRALNYIGSEIAAQIKNSSRSQWLATPDNVMGQQEMWRNPELQSGALLAQPDPKNGQMPQKLPPSELSQSLLLHYQRLTSDLKEIIGFYDTNLGGDNGSEVSGVAIQNRAMQGNASTYVYQDNLMRAIEQGARITLDLLPKVYDSERSISIISDNNDTRSITLNKQLPNGQIENSLEEGDFDIEMDSGPSFALQKAQALQVFIQLIQTNPQVFPLVADLLAKNFDLENSQQIVDRLKTMVPPNILAKEEGKPMPPPQPNPQLQMAQQSQQIEMQKLQQRQQEINQKQQEMQLEKERLLLQFHQLDKDQKNDLTKSAVELHKAELSFSSDMAELLHEREQAHLNANRPSS